MIRFIGQSILYMILLVIYYGVFTPLGIMVRLFWDPLDRTVPDERESFWVHKPPVVFDPKAYEKQK